MLQSVLNRSRKKDSEREYKVVETNINIKSVKYNISSCASACNDVNATQRSAM